MPIIDMVETGKRIKTACRERGISAAQIAEMVGVSAVAAYKWFRGASVPSVDNVVALAAIFQIPMDDLIATKFV